MKTVKCLINSCIFFNVTDTDSNTQSKITQNIFSYHFQNSCPKSLSIL